MYQQRETGSVRKSLYAKCKTSQRNCGFGKRKTGLCASMLLIPWLGAPGAAIATLIVTLTVAVMDCTYVLRYFKAE